MNSKRTIIKMRIQSYIMIEVQKCTDINFEDTFKHESYKEAIDQVFS